MIPIDDCTTKIGPYRRNIDATASKNGGIKSPDIIDEQGTAFYGIKAREYQKKNTASLELWHIKA